MTDDRTLVQIITSAHKIDQQWPIYHARRLDWRRGSLPQNSMPEHVSGSGESGILESDELDRRISDEWTQIKAALDRALRELRGVERMMAFVVNSTKRPEDPTPRACSNPNCPDVRVFTMVGRDRPQDAQGRCDSCRKFYGRNGRERTSINAYALQTAEETA